MRARATSGGNAIATAQTAIRAFPLTRTRGHQQRNARVQRDRRGRVARGVARGRVEALETLDVRARTLDEERRRAVRPGLDGDGEDHERADAPAPQRRAHDEDDAESDGYHLAAGDLVPDPGKIRPRLRALARQPPRQALVEPLDPTGVEHHLGDEQAGGDRRRRERGDSPRMTVIRNATTGWRSPRARSDRASGPSRRGSSAGTPLPAPPRSLWSLDEDVAEAA